MRPEQYLTLESSPVPLLSRIYGHLSRHFERQSSPLIRAVIAFILTSTSNTYIHEVSLSIGYGGQPKIMSRKVERPHDGLEFDDEENEEEDMVMVLMEKMMAEMVAKRDSRPARRTKSTRESS